jgi:autotransporter-associated beta strand protein
VSLSGSGTTALGAKTLTIATATGTLSGIISGDGGSMVISSGNQILTGSNTYSGTTTINDGAT